MLNVNITTRQQIAQATGRCYESTTARETTRHGCITDQRMRHCLAQRTLLCAPLIPSTSMRLERHWLHFLSHWYEKASVS